MDRELVAQKSGRTFSDDEISECSSNNDESENIEFESLNEEDYEYREEVEKKKVEFMKFIEKRHIEIANKWKEYKGDNIWRKALLKRYPMLKTINKDKNRKYKEMSEMLIDTFERNLSAFFKELQEKGEFNEKIASIVLDHYRKKIQLLKKHTQCEKTAIDIRRILLDFDTCISIIMCKNSLMANSQFVQRFMKMLKKFLKTNPEYKNIELKNVIYVLRHAKIEKNDPLYGYVTWCKTKDELFSKLGECKGKAIIFNCSNSVRVSDMDWIIRRFEKYPQPLEGSKIMIHVDEAHNISNGIPAFRGNYERMIISPLVQKLIPISASEEKLYGMGGKCSLWDIKTMSANRFKYGVKDRKKSDDPNYSSIKDATAIAIDDWEYSGKWAKGNRYGDNVWGKSGYDDKEREKRGMVVKNSFCGDEDDCLNFIEYLSKNNCYHNGEPIFKANKGIYVMLAPLRTILTRQMQHILCRMKIEGGKNPIVISLYGGKFLPRWKDNGKYCNRTIALKKAGEFNEYLAKWLDEHPTLKDRPIIVIGNKYMVGESITFVESDSYGYVRAVIVPPGVPWIQLKDEAYQFMSRLCFEISRFIKTYKQRGEVFTKKDIQKFIIGPQNAIDACLSYEETNDLWCDTMNEIPDTPQDEMQREIKELCEKRNEESLKNTIPTRVTWRKEKAPKEWEKYQKMLGKNEGKKRRFNAKDKKKFVDNLIEAEKKGALIIMDKNTTKIQLSYLREKLKEVRCYHYGDNIDNRRFRQYYTNFEIGEPYAHCGKLKPGECAIECAFNDFYQGDKKYCDEKEFYIAQKIK